MLRLAEHVGGCRVRELSERIVMIPFNEAVRAAAGARPQGANPDSDWPFEEIDRGTAQRLARVAGAGRIAYVEVEYFGNAGGQSAVGWQNGECNFGPKSSVAGIINEAARFLGDRATSGQDELDTLGLGKHRRTEQW